ncbi:GntR family transcriptional regulator [Sinirhodobacter sp. WL0062]|uniref:GntR family transcriptional regulator n=1 Tax=Rhodobacter flavimaris TaxID=2907145 RepID=A0ABS8YVQ2_9RHOB|nr:GntR family transcriptional regulator [Sinirhodobacter sp. WL0062]
MTDQQNIKSEQIALLLTTRIVRGEFAPGEKLLQDHIAREYGVSHVTVREAFLYLAGRGLALRLPRRGICVAPLDRSAVEELRLMRQALEPMALLHSVPHLTPAQIAHAEAMRLACDAAQTAVDWEEANRQFHMAIIAGCGMARLSEEIDNLQLLYARHFLAKHASRWKPRSDPDHQAIMSAIRERDAARASAVMQRHLARLS